MAPKGGRIWAWIFPLMVGASILFGFQGANGAPLALALETTCLVIGLVGTFLLFEFKNIPLRCGKCQEPAPSLRLPSGRKQALSGGWECRKCGAELDRKGQPLNG